MKCCEHFTLSKIFTDHYFFLPVLVCDRALPATLLTAFDAFGLLSILAALLATEALVCFLFIIPPPFAWYVYIIPYIVSFHNNNIFLIQYVAYQKAEQLKKWLKVV